MSAEKDTTSESVGLTPVPLSPAEKRKAKQREYDKIRGATPEKKAADRAYKKAAREADPEKYAAKTKLWRDGHPEESRAFVREWQKNNKDRMKAGRKEYYERNKEVVKAKSRAYHAANREQVIVRARERHQATKGKRYGLTPSEYLEMVVACKGRCPCCKVPFSKIINEQHCVDHDHKLGLKNRKAVRGIVCHRCNAILGFAADDPKILRACARHLEKIKTDPPFESIARR